jgi:hypothetical protein
MSSPIRQNRKCNSSLRTINGGTLIAITNIPVSAPIQLELELPINYPLSLRLPGRRDPIPPEEPEPS